MGHRPLRFRDPVSGLEVSRVSDPAIACHHFYFTNPGWIDGGRAMLVGAMIDGAWQLHRLDLASGRNEAITSLPPVPLPRELEFIRACRNPLREEAYCFYDRSVLAVDLASGRSRTLCEFPATWCTSMANCDADGETLYFGTWDDQSHRFPVDLLRGYVGFRETWAAMPRSRVMAVPTAGGAMRTIFEEDYWIGHVNASPTRSGHLTYCHEGPWQEVDCRIWGLDAASGRSWRIRPAAPGEVVGHEYWYADGERIGYHGHGAGGSSLFGSVRWDGSGVEEWSCAGSTGHIFSHDESLIVGDGGGVIRLWRRGPEGYLPAQVLCRHDSAMAIQQTHPHPVLSPDGRSVAFTSDRDGVGGVYVVQLPEDLERLPLAGD